MKTIQLHPTSLFVGAAVVGLAFLTMAQTPQPISPTTAFRSSQPIILARDYVQIRQGTPYVVPPNKILVITALGSETDVSSSTTELLVNGATRLRANYPALYHHGMRPTSMAEVPRGLTIPAGDVVSVGNNLAAAWGYLADA